MEQDMSIGTSAGPTKFKRSKTPIGTPRFQKGQLVVPTYARDQEPRAIDGVEWNRQGWWDLVFEGICKFAIGSKREIKVTTRSWEGLYCVK
jgi:hypothetical protein